MKKIYLIAALFAANVVSAQNADFESISLTNESYWDGSDYSGASNGFGLFDTVITDGPCSYPNQYDTTWGGNWGYWSQGWAFSNQTPDTTIGGTYSSYAGGAHGGANYGVGKQYANLYFGSITATAGIKLYITNNNYAAHSMLNGDMFAKKFGSIYNADGDVDSTNGEDWFLITAIGYDANYNIIDSALFYLADFRFQDSTQDYIVKDWTLFDLSNLGNASTIQFKLSSSDVGQYGMNTPAFFAIDDISLQFTGINEMKNKKLVVYPNPATDIVTVQTNSNNGTVQIFDISGKLLNNENYTSETFQLNIANYPAGTYYVVLTSENARQTTKLIKL